MLSRFLKPKWQHKDPAVRLAGIATVEDEKTLFQIAREDTDAAVRKAAAEKLSQIDHLLEIHGDESLRTTVGQRLHQLLTEDSKARLTSALEAFLRSNADPALLQSLAREANDPRLRQVAVDCLDDTDLLIDRAANDASADVRQCAADRLEREADIRQALKKLGRKDKRVAKTLRQKLEALNQRKALLERLDQQLAALKKLGRNPHWQRDQTRLGMLENQTLEWLPQLDQVHQQTFTKALDAARARIDERRQASEAIQPVIEAKESQCRLVEDFCQKLEQRHRISRNESEEFNLTLDVFRADWNDLPLLEEKLEARLSNRFHAGLARARKRIDALKANTRQSKNLESCIHRAENLLKQPAPAPGQVEKLIAEWNQQKLPEDPELAEEYRSHFQRLQNSLEHRIAQQRKQTDQALEKIFGWLDTIDATLATDKLGNAETLRNQVQAELKKLPRIPARTRREIDARLQAINPRIRELTGWRHWGTNRAREELIEEAEALRDSTDQIDIDKRLAAVKSLRKRWKDLGNIDPVSRQRLWKRFDAACTAAYEPCKAHFEQEAAQRQENLKKRQQICEALETLAGDTDWKAVDWRETDKRFHQLRNQWRHCGPVARRHWQTILDRFNAAVEAVDQHLDKERQRNFRQRTRLVEQLEALQAQDDLQAAITEAKALQKQWQLTVTSRRGAENKLWKRFRAASDALFKRDQAHRESARAELQELIAARETFCAELEDLTLDGDITSARLDTMIDQWREFEPHYGREFKRLEERFQRAVNAAQHHLMQQTLRQQRAKLDSLFHYKQRLDQFLQDAERERLASAWNETEPMDDPQLMEKIQACRETLLSEPADESRCERDQNHRDELLLDMEILLGIDSPEEVRKQRMERQVSRLASRMTERGGEEDSNSLMEKFIDYCLTPFAQPDRLKLDQQRLAAIHDAFAQRLDSQLS